MQGRNKNEDWKELGQLLPKDLLQEYQDSFEIMDRQNTGKLSIQELSLFFSSINIHLTKKEIQFYANEILDIDISYACEDERIFEFCHFLGLIVGISMEQVSGEDFISVFEEFDSDKDGFITRDDLKSLLMRLGDDVTDDDVIEMMKEADKDGDGMVSMEDFINVMRITNGNKPYFETNEHQDDILKSPEVRDQNHNSKCNIKHHHVCKRCGSDSFQSYLEPDNVKHQKSILKRAKIFLKEKFKKRLFKTFIK